MGVLLKLIVNDGRDLERGALPVWGSQLGLGKDVRREARSRARRRLMVGPNCNRFRGGWDP